jgi:hypothetical protein
MLGLSLSSQGLGLGEPENAAPPASGSHLAAETGDILATEGGDQFVVEE